MYMTVCVCDEFLAARNGKNAVLDFSGQTCASKGYFIHILYVNVVLEKL